MNSFYSPWLFLICFLLVSAWAIRLPAKTPPSAPAPIPGAIQKLGGAEQIFLEAGRTVVWPSQGPLLVKGQDGTILAKVDLGGKGKSASGVQAMGLEVEETDLGGSLGSKTYLQGKKQPMGRRLATEALVGKEPAEQAGKETPFEVQGISMSSIAYPNGAFLLTIRWPDREEKIYFDRRKTMVYDEQIRKVSSYRFGLKQYADGSFVRSYQSAAGEFRYTYDSNDKSYLFSFLNRQGEIVAELSCQEKCEEV